jgi:predicted nuclease with TOPRIM domain
MSSKSETYQLQRTLQYLKEDIYRLQKRVDELEGKTSFRSFMDELEVEAERAGPEVLAELRAFDRHFARKLEKLIRLTEEFGGYEAEDTNPKPVT